MIKKIFYMLKWLNKKSIDFAYHFTIGDSNTMNNNLYDNYFFKNDEEKNRLNKDLIDAKRYMLATCPFFRIKIYSCLLFLLVIFLFIIFAIIKVNCL